MKKLMLIGTGALALAVGTAAEADTFVNGSFDGGTLTGWTQGGGFWDGSGGYPVPAQYLPGGAKYDPTGIEISITNAGFDPNTGNTLRTAFAGDHSARINTPGPNYSVSVLSQTVSNYSDSLIAFSYAAVLEESHGLTDSDAFIITLQDLTDSTTLFSRNLNSAAAPGLFTYNSATGYYYTDWVSESFDVSGLQGHTFQLSLLANDCPYGGHAGYAYLDGFGSVVGGGGTGSAVPEPATWATMVGGFGLLGGTLRSRRRRTALA